MSVKLRIKKNDSVCVIAGRDKGKTGIVKKVFPERNRAIVANINQVKKHKKPTQATAGGIEVVELPIHISNLALVCPKTSKPTRIGYRFDGQKKVRFAKKSDSIIE